MRDVLPKTAQRRTSKRPFAETGLAVLAVAVAALALQALLAANVDPSLVRASGLLRLKLLSVDQALTLLFALLSLIIVYKQFAFGLRPYLVAMSGRRNESLLGLLPENPVRVWRVVIRNAGSGAALVREYSFAVARSANEPLEHIYAHDVVVDTLSREHKKMYGEDYVVANYSRGMAIAAGTEVVVFECVLREAPSALRISVKLVFESTLGEIFEKEVSLLPVPYSEPTPSHAA